MTRSLRFAGQPAQPIQQSQVPRTETVSKNKADIRRTSEVDRHASTHKWPPHTTHKHPLPSLTDVVVAQE